MDLFFLKFTLHNPKYLFKFNLKLLKKNQIRYIILPPSKECLTKNNKMKELVFINVILSFFFMIFGFQSSGQTFLIQ
ncbi:hypothetical protein CMESO_421 (nucleomorph) [Chroomonas mesostigmatica CCMP1168]|uniref:Uncharacterized protein n=1 Tax=Chroomonas mesostigmatica CCMP1168 TaxID=1195612 RepID=J7G8H5_9CRYP|nr:hypothetical protein CMESO_421 [Chroomonas mesostigmatica CCMP1168]